MKEVRDTVKTKNPQLSPTELTTVIAKMWKSLDATKRDKYSNLQTEELVLYKDAIAKYKNSLTADQIRRIKEAKVEDKERKAATALRQKSVELGKPRKPIQSFLKYLQEQTDRKPDEEHKAFLKRVSVNWKALPESEKEKYKANSIEIERYR